MTFVKSKPIQTSPSVRTISLTAVTMVFFAANSLLARFALRAGEIDAGSFTAVRIGSGAVTLLLLASFRRETLGTAIRQGSLRAGFALFVYAFTFSYAYLLLSAGTGALVMFATVQMTMLGVGIARGEGPPPAEWSGLALALGGLIYLAFPGLTAPSAMGILVMMVSGAAWGYYSISVKGVQSPIAANAGNFARATPLAAVVFLIIWSLGQTHLSWAGIGLAATSGAITSGLGYVIWSVALKGLRTSLAAIVQLTVPVITAAAGVIILGEQLTWRVVFASAAILGGVALALIGKFGAHLFADRS